MTIVAFALAVQSVNQTHKKHFAGPNNPVHQAFGYFVFFGAVFQPVIGQMANKWFDPKRSGVPVFPDMVHWWLGRGLFILGIVNVFLGLKAYSAKPLAYILIAIVVAFIFGFYIFKQLTVGQQHDAEPTNDKEMTKSGEASKSA